AALARRSADAAASLEGIAEIRSRRRELILRTESLQAQRNTASQEMAKLAKTDKAAFEARREELRQPGDDVKAAEAELSAIEAEIGDRLLGVPNTPHASAPDGAGSDDNPVRRVVGERPSYEFEPKPHWEIGAALGILDFERASKLSGPRFSVLWGL